MPYKAVVLALEFLERVKWHPEVELHTVDLFQLKTIFG